MNTNINGNALTTTGNTGGYATTNAIQSVQDMLDGLTNQFSKIDSNYRIELTKAENGGFVIQVMKSPMGDYSGWANKKPKIYINTDVENLGRDIQNALMIEILKQ